MHILYTYLREQNQSSLLSDVLQYDKYDITGVTNPLYPSVHILWEYDITGEIHHPYMYLWVYHESLSDVLQRGQYDIGGEEGLRQADPSIGAVIQCSLHPLHRVCHQRVLYKAHLEHFSFLVVRS